MALLHIEGFDEISAGTGTSSRTDLSRWVRAGNYYNVGYDDTNTNSPNYQPYLWPGWGADEAWSFGENGFASGYHLGRYVGDKTTLIVGFAFQPTQFAESETREILTFGRAESTNNRHCSIRCHQGRHLQVVSNTNSVYLGAAKYAIHKAVWNYIEAKVTFNNSTGSVVLRVNGVEVLSLSNVDTVAGTTATSADTVFIWGMDGSTSTNSKLHALYDDWYICDDTGTENNDFLGPLKVETLLPDGAGDDTDFTPSAGSNFQNVDETPIDDGTTYNESDTSAHLDLFTTANLNNIDGDIFGVEVDVRAVSTEAQVMGCIPKIKRSTSEGTGDTTYVADDNLYQQCDHLFEQDPAAGPGDWTVTNVNAMQIGYEVE